MFKNKNVRIGLFGVGAFVILCIGLNFLKGRDLFFTGDKFYAYYKDINGLTDASPVIYCGYKVGAVREIKICPEEIAERRFEVTLAIDVDIDIPKDSRVEIFSTDILGGKGIDIVWGTSSEVAQSGDELTSSVRIGLAEQLEPLKDKAEQLVMRLDTALLGITNIIGGENGEQLSSAIQSLNHSMRNIEKVTSNVAQLTSRNSDLYDAMVNLDSLMVTLNNQGSNIDSMMSNLTQFSDDLANSDINSLVSNMNITITGLGNIVNSIDSAKGSLGKIINETELYDNVNRLLVDLRLNPSRYISISALKFGKDIYVSSPDIAEALKGEIYTVKISESKDPMDIPTEIEGYKVMEYQQGSKYLYLLGIVKTKAEAEKVLEKVKTAYPKSKIAKYKNGVEISLTD